jgi:hypothetical protein
MLSEGAHAHFTEVLTAWGTANVDIEDTLRWATFCPCVVELISDDPELPPCVGIVIDETQDEDLARLFALRERLEDDEFFANWEVSPNRAARIVLDPESPRRCFAMPSQSSAPSGSNAASCSSSTPSCNDWPPSSDRAQKCC